MNGANPFDYLTELQQRAEVLAACPERWMPWNYRDALVSAFRVRDVPGVGAGQATLLRKP